MPKEEVPHVLRSTCHLALDTVPDEGLAEVYRMLLDAAAFYQNPRHPTLPPPTTSVKVVWGTTSVRPEFPIVEE